MESAGSVAAVFETANYAVYIKDRTDEGLPVERRKHYFVYHKQHNVLFETTSQLGGAIIAAQSLQMHLDEITARDGQPSAPVGKAN